MGLFFLLCTFIGFATILLGTMYGIIYCIKYLYDHYKKPVDQNAHILIRPSHDLQNLQKLVEQLHDTAEKTIWPPNILQTDNLITIKQNEKDDEYIKFYNHELFDLIKYLQTAEDSTDWPNREPHVTIEQDGIKIRVARNSIPKFIYWLHVAQTKYYNGHFNKRT